MIGVAAVAVGDEALLELFALSASPKMLLTVFEETLLLAVPDDFVLPSPPELLLDSLSSAVNGNSIATVCRELCQLR